MIKNITAIFISLLLPSFCIGQRYKDSSVHRIFFTTGFGAAGSFYVRDYEETLPFPSPGYTSFMKKNFLGTAQEIAIGIHLKKNIDLKGGYNRQRFTRHVFYNDTLNTVGILIDHTIQNVDNMYFIGMAKNFIRGRSQFSWGAGLSFWANYDHVIEIYGRYVIDQESRIQDWRKDLDLGAYAEFASEYSFQPKVNLGLKTQVWYIVSGSYFTTIALFPYIKLNF